MSRVPLDHILAQQNSEYLPYLYQIFVLISRVKEALSSSGETFQAGRELSRVPLDHTLAQQNSEYLPYLYQIFFLVSRGKKALSSSGEAFQAGRELSRIPLDYTLAQQQASLLQLAQSLRSYQQENSNKESF
jgi:hypothetical protein